MRSPNLNRNPSMNPDKRRRDDDRILTYADATLLRSDLAILRGPHYLNDRLIHFFFARLAASHKEIDDDILLAPPSLAYLIANFPDPDPASLSDLVAPLHLPRKALLLFPVNDNPDVTLAEGGFHWSLLVCHMPSRQFVHHDSTISRLNSQHAHMLSSRLRVLLGPTGANFQYQEGPTPRQTNGYDCGLYVMAIARCVCEWYSKVKNNPSMDTQDKWFGFLSDQLNGDKVPQLRGELLSLVLSLTLQNDSN